jgi:signal transduction histidine kinase
MSKTRKEMERVQRAPTTSSLLNQDLTERDEKKMLAKKLNGRKRLQEEVEELRLSYERAQEANRANREFINTLSHELRTPIHVIVGCGELLLDGAWGMLQEKQKEIVAKMKQNACYLFGLITDLMELNFTEGERSAARCEEINVNGLLEEVEEMTQFMPKANGMVLELNRPVECPPLFGDRDKLKIILRNLVGNAVKFTHAGRVTIGAHFDPKEQMIQFSVRDNGVGIDEKDLQRIFDMFWQADNSRAHPFAGVGLGLYIVKRLAAQIDAKIEVESKKGKGSLFRLIVPVKLGWPLKDIELTS